MKQERFNPSTSVSNWQGRSEYLKGYPGKAMSDALNGGFFGGSKQTPAERWTYISDGHNGNNFGVTNINTATPKYDEILIWVNSSQNSNWSSDASIYLGYPQESGGYGVGGSTFIKRGNWGGMSYGSETSSTLQFKSGISNYSAGLWIYVTNCASTTDYKPFMARHSYGGGSSGQYQDTYWMYGIIQRTTVMNDFFVRNPYNNGDTQYQWWGVWGGRRAE
jgi:hypothetical protein